MFAESLPRLMKDRQRYRKDGASKATPMPSEGLAQGWGASWPMAMDFPRSKLRVNVMLPIMLGFFGGILVALLGVGGGFVMVPAMIYILRMPPILVNGTSLFQIIFTTGFAAILQAISNHSVDLVLALLLLLGSVVFVPMGARLASRLPPVVARLLMAVLILSVAGMLIADMTLTPRQLFAVEVSAP